MLRSSAFGLHASECVFCYCVRTYEASVQENVLQQKVTNVWYSEDATVVTGQIWEDPFNGPPEGPGDDLVFTPPSDQWAALNISEPTNFTVDWYTADNLQWEWLPTALTGNFYLMGSDDTETTSSDYIVQQLFNNLCYATDQDVAPMFEVLTMYMTDKFRRTCPSNIAAVGTAIGTGTVLDVQWNWFILPVAVIALTVVFLGLTIYQSKEHPLMLWKDEVLHSCSMV